MMLRTAPVEYVAWHHWGGHPPKTIQRALAICLGEGFSTFPYNVTFTPEGETWQGRDVKYVNAANLGINEISLSACFLGNFDKGDNPRGLKGLPMLPTDPQLEAAAAWARKIHAQFPAAKFILHSDVQKIKPKAWLASAGELVSTATACPGSRFREGKYGDIIWKMVNGHSLAEAKRLVLGH